MILRRIVLVLANLAAVGFGIGITYGWNIGLAAACACWLLMPENHV